MARTNRPAPGPTEVPARLGPQADAAPVPPEPPAAGEADGGGAGADTPPAALRTFRYRVDNAFVSVTGEVVAADEAQVRAAVAAWLTSGLTIAEE